MTPLAVVADAHISGPGGDGRELFDQLRLLPQQGCTDLLLLGDLFHVWIGSHKYETPAIREFVRLAGKLRRHGVKLHYVEGNRDFFLADSPYRALFDRYGPELDFEVAEPEGIQRILAVHGDRANPQDWHYRVWAAISKSAPVRFLMRQLPGPAARRSVLAAERGIARTNQQHRHEIPTEALENYSRTRLADGYDLLVMGHFHQALTLELAEGEARVIDAWFNSRRVEWLP